MMTRSSSRAFRCVLLGAAVLLAAADLAFAAEEDTAALTDSAQADPATASTVEVGTLPPQQLDAGKCGLFLWTKSSDPRLVFASLEGGTAHMIVDGEDLMLYRNVAEGQEFLGQFETQDFYATDLTVALSMAFEAQGAVGEGVVVRTATLRLREASGWETVIPVGGLIGCENT